MKQKTDPSRNQYGYPRKLRKDTTQHLVKQQKAKDNRNEYGYPKE